MTYLVLDRLLKLLGFLLFLRMKNILPTLNYLGIYLYNYKIKISIIYNYEKNPTLSEIIRL